MDRFLTKFSVALNYRDAIKFAIADGTPCQEIVVSNNVMPVHIKRASHIDLCSWVWWSDSRLTTANGLPLGLKAKKLSSDAVKLITLALEGNTYRKPTWSWKRLAEVEKIVNVKNIAVNNRKENYNPKFINIINAKSQRGNIIILLTISGSQQEIPFCQFYDISPKKLDYLLSNSNDISIEKLLVNIEQTY